MTSVGQVLHEIREILEGRDPSKESENYTPPIELNVLDRYIHSLIDSLVYHEGATLENAIAFIMFQADLHAEAGLMPPLPEDSVSGEELAMWVGRAQLIGFHGRVVDAWRRED